MRFTKSQLKEEIRKIVKEQLSVEEEAELQERDERVAKTLASAIDDLEAELLEAKENINRLRKEMNRIEIAVRDGHWWLLRGYLLPGDVNSLSEIEPVDFWKDVEEHRRTSRF